MDTPRAQPLPLGISLPKPDELVQVPGLYQRWELQQIVRPGFDYHIETGGKLTDGTPLFAVYSRQARGRRVV